MAPPLKARKWQAGRRLRADGSEVKQALLPLEHCTRFKQQGSGEVPSRTRRVSASGEGALRVHAQLSEL